MVVEMCQLGMTHSVDLPTRSLDKFVDHSLSWDALGDLRQPSVTVGISRVAELRGSQTN